MGANQSADHFRAQSYPANPYGISRGPFQFPTTDSNRGTHTLVDDGSTPHSGSSGSRGLQPLDPRNFVFASSPGGLQPLNAAGVARAPQPNTLELQEQEQLEMARAASLADYQAHQGLQQPARAPPRTARPAEAPQDDLRRLEDEQLQLALAASRATAAQQSTSSERERLEQEQIERALAASRAAPQPAGAAPTPGRSAPQAGPNPARASGADRAASNSGSQPLPRTQSDSANDFAIAAALQEAEVATRSPAGAGEPGGISVEPASTVGDAALAAMLAEEEQQRARTGAQSGQSAPAGSAGGGGPAPGRTPRGQAPGFLAGLPSLGAAFTCPGCNLPLLSSAMVYQGRGWHHGCFKCGACGEPIRDRQFRERDGVPYHTHCARDRFDPRCRVCAEHIAANSEGLIVYSEHPFFKDKFCREHGEDGTPACTACTRLQPRAAPFVPLEDGRSLCLDCLGSVVVDTADAQPLYNAVLDWFTARGMGWSQMPQKPPLVLVDQGTLNSEAVHEGDYHGGGLVRGVCLTQERVIQTVVREPAASTGGGRLPIATRARAIEQFAGCKVTAICVLYGLPRLLCGSIVAHECMHAWLRTTGFRGLPEKVEEGLCQLMAMLWLEEEVPKTGEGQVEAGSYFAHAIQTDRSEVYGDGFREALVAYNKFGLEQVLAHVKQCKQLPL